MVKAKAKPKAESAPHEASTKTLLWDLLVVVSVHLAAGAILARPGVSAPGRAKGSPG